jgi:hypothetical protein
MNAAIEGRETSTRRRTRPLDTLIGDLLKSLFQGLPSFDAKRGENVANGSITFQSRSIASFRADDGNQISGSPLSPQRTVACPGAAQKTVMYRSRRSFNWQSGAVGRYENLNLDLGSFRGDQRQSYCARFHNACGEICDSSDHSSAGAWSSAARYLVSLQCTLPSRSIWSRPSLPPSLWPAWRSF